MGTTDIWWQRAVISPARAVIGDVDVEWVFWSSCPSNTLDRVGNIAPIIFN